MKRRDTSADSPRRSSANQTRRNCSFLRPDWKCGGDLRTVTVATFILKNFFCSRTATSITYTNSSIVFSSVSIYINLGAIDQGEGTGGGRGGGADDVDDVFDAHWSVCVAEKGTKAVTFLYLRAFECVSV